MSEWLPQVQTPAPPGAPVTQAPGAPTATPAPVVAPPPTIIIDGVTRNLPRTNAEIRALQSQRSELSDQLRSATGRREDLVGELEGTSGAVRAGLEARIKLLDERILQIESDIASTGQLLAAARGTNIPADPRTPRPPGMDPSDLVPIIAILSVFVFAPIAIAFARNIWRRGTLQKHESPIEMENAARLSRLEGAIDSIAIEMERVSEGQRFVTKLLAESQGREHARIERQ